MAIYPFPPIVVFAFFAVFGVNCVVEGCRFALYSGRRSISSSELWTNPPHSLMRQSRANLFVPLYAVSHRYTPDNKRLRNHLEHLDGWGTGWYDEIGGNLMVTRSPKPALDNNKEPDPELVRTAPQVSSHTIFAHIRATTQTIATQNNSHPFRFGNLLWMHNGGIPDIDERRKSLMHHIPQHIQAMIHGNTDTEFAGALFVSQLRNFPQIRYTAEDLNAAMRSAISLLTQKLNSTSQREQKPTTTSEGRTCLPSTASLNFAVTDGETVVATRFRNCQWQDPPSLYYAVGEAWLGRGMHNSDQRAHPEAEKAQKSTECELPRYNPSRTDEESTHNRASSALVVSSEPLDFCVNRWVLLAKDQMLTYSRRTGDLQLSCLTDDCHEDLLYKPPEAAGGVWALTRGPALARGLAWSV